MNLEEIQKRFDTTTEKKYWSRLHDFFFSDKKETVAQGMNLLENLDEEVYYDGICTFLEVDEGGNWILKAELGCQNALALSVEIYRCAQENEDHDIHEAFKCGRFESLFMRAFVGISFGEVEPAYQDILIDKVRDFVSIDHPDGAFEIMKYPVTQAFWMFLQSVNPSKNVGATLPVGNVSWLDCVIFANQLSTKEGRVSVYQNIPSELQIGMTYPNIEQTQKWADQITVNSEANGYRLPTENQWEFAAKSGCSKKFSGSDEVDEVGWYSKNTKHNLQAVGLKRKNLFGLYDMSGNVFETCWNNWDSDSYSRVLRGGSFEFAKLFCNVEYRSWICPSKKRKDVGFRLIRR